MSNPEHEEHHDSFSWLGIHFDPERFSVAQTNVAVQRMR
jgi:hypothetical protein